MDPQPVRMFWSSCAAGLDCTDDGTDRWLNTPTIGPVVKEAHLVTVGEFPGGWPQSFTDGIQAHDTASEALSGYAMDRTEPWAPAGEGGSEYGQGATGGPVPLEDEAWWETGPGSNERIAGVTEEVHDHLGSVHLSELEIGFAADPDLPLGSIDCAP